MNWLLSSIAVLSTVICKNCVDATPLISLILSEMLHNNSKVFKF